MNRIQNAKSAKSLKPAHKREQEKILTKTRPRTKIKRRISLYNIKSLKILDVESKMAARKLNRPSRSPNCYGMIPPRIGFSKS